jgi:hypothetical protein
LLEQTIEEKFYLDRLRCPFQKARLYSNQPSVAIIDRRGFYARKSLTEASNLMKTVEMWPRIKDDLTLEISWVFI